MRSADLNLNRNYFVSSDSGSEWYPSLPLPESSAFDEIFVGSFSIIERTVLHPFPKSKIILAQGLKAEHKRRKIKKFHYDICFGQFSTFIEGEFFLSGSINLNSYHSFKSTS